MSIARHLFPLKLQVPGENFLWKSCFKSAKITQKYTKNNQFRSCKVYITNQSSILLHFYL